MHFENGELRLFSTGVQNFARYKIQPEAKAYPLNSRQLFWQEPRQRRLDDDRRELANPSVCDRESESESQ